MPLKDIMDINIYQKSEIIVKLYEHQIKYIIINELLENKLLY